MGHFDSQHATVCTTVRGTIQQLCVAQVPALLPVAPLCQLQEHIMTTQTVCCDIPRPSLCLGKYTRYNIRYCAATCNNNNKNVTIKSPLLNPRTPNAQRQQCNCHQTDCVTDDRQSLTINFGSAKAPRQRNSLPNGASR